MKNKTVKAWAVVGYEADPNGLWQFSSLVDEKDCFAYAVCSTRKEAKALANAMGITYEYVVPCTITYSLPKTK